MQYSEIRRRFIEYYRQRGFQSVPRAPMLHPSIPMSFVMSAGRTQIDDAIAAGTYRAGDQYVLLQPCFRHFDLDKIRRSVLKLVGRKL